MNFNILRCEVLSGLLVGASEMKQALDVADANAAISRKLLGQFGLQRPPGDRSFNRQPVELKSVEWGPQLQAILAIGATSGFDRQGQPLIVPEHWQAAIEIPRRKLSADGILVYLERDEAATLQLEQPTEFTPQVLPVAYRLALESSTGIPICRLLYTATPQKLELDPTFLAPCYSLCASESVERLCQQLLSLTDSFMATCRRAVNFETVDAKSWQALQLLTALEKIRSELLVQDNLLGRALAMINSAYQSMEWLCPEESSATASGTARATAYAADLPAALQRLERIHQQAASLLGKSTVGRGVIKSRCLPIEPSVSWKRVVLELEGPLEKDVKLWGSNRIAIHFRAHGMEHQQEIPVHPTLPCDSIKRRPISRLNNGEYHFEYAAEADDLAAAWIVFYVPPYVTVAEDSPRVDVLVV